MAVADYLTLNELRRRAKKAKDPIEQEGRGPDREGPFPGRLSRQAGPHRQGGRQDYPRHPPLGPGNGAALQPGGPRGPQRQAAPEPGAEAQARGEFPEAFLGLPGCIPFRPREASFPLSLPAGFMRRGRGILGNTMHAGPRSRPFQEFPSSKDIFCENDMKSSCFLPLSRGSQSLDLSDRRLARRVLLLEGRLRKDFL